MYKSNSKIRSEIKIMHQKSIQKINKILETKELQKFIMGLFFTYSGEKM